MKNVTCVLSLVYCLLAATADAAPARLVGTFAMRTSPAWDYPIVAVVPSGALVNARIASVTAGVV